MMGWSKIALFAVSLSMVAGGQATVLTFDINPSPGDGGPMPNAYGDNVTATTMGNYSYGAAGGFTPDISVDYAGSASGDDANWWSTGYNDLVNVLEYEPDGANGYWAVFTPANGATMTITSFDVGNWGGDITVPGISIVQNGQTLWSVNNFFLPGSTNQSHLHFTPNISSDQRLYLMVDTTGLGGNSDNVGLDNIQFSQTTVPEPASLAALALGGIALLRRRAAKRRS